MRRLGESNKTNLFMRFLTCMIVCMMCISSFGVMAFAADDDDGMTVTLNVTDSAKASKVFEGSDTGLPGLTCSSSETAFTFTWDGGVELSGKTAKEQKKAIKKFMTKLDKSNVSAQATSDLSTLLGQTADDATVEMSVLLLPYIIGETKGDVLGGMNILSGFLPYINIVIGIGAILLVSLLVLSTVLDLAFIGLPQFREWMFDKADKGGNGGGKVKGITYAAKAAVEEVEGNGSNGGGSGKNIYLTYLKKRIFDYIILGVALAFLVIGGFENIFSAFLDIGVGLSGN